MSVIQNMLQQLLDLTRRLNDINANAKRTEDLDILPEVTDDAQVRVTVQGISYRSAFKQEGLTPTLDDVSQEGPIALIPLTAPAFIVQDKTNDDILLGAGGTRKATDFAKSIDLSAHIQDLNNPHIVQSLQIPDGANLKLLFENSLL